VWSYNQQSQWIFDEYTYLCGYLSQNCSVPVWIFIWKKTVCHMATWRLLNFCCVCLATVHLLKKCFPILITCGLKRSLDFMWTQYSAFYQWKWILICHMKHSVEKLHEILEYRRRCICQITTIPLQWTFTSNNLGTVEIILHITFVVSVHRLVHSLWLPLCCHICGVCVTYNNRFWFEWLDLLTLLLQPLLITINYNSSQSLTM
jgi:hypothetical protein